MDGTIIGLVAVIMSLGIPLGAMYTFYRVRQLRTEEHLAAIAKGVSVPMGPELAQATRSRRAGILLTCGAVGFIVAPATRDRSDPKSGKSRSGSHGNSVKCPVVSPARARRLNQLARWWASADVARIGGGPDGRGRLRRT